MAPKASDGTTNRSITDFFKRFSIPKSRGPANDEFEEEIVVASSRPDSRSSESIGKPQSRKATTTTPKKPGTKSTLSSSPSDINTLKRKRTSPRLSESQSNHASASPGGFHSETLPRNVNPVTGVKDVTPTHDSPFREASATPSRRVLLGSSPGSASSKSKPNSVSPEQMAAPPIPPPQFARPAKDGPATISFTSASTLSTAPFSSQTSSMPVSSTTSSRRVVIDGLKAVTNSDSDDSDDELADLSSFLVKRPKLTPPAEPLRSVPRSSTATTTRSSDHGAKTRFTKPLPLSPPRADFKNSKLAKLVAKNEERKLAQERIKAMEMEVEESKQRDAMTEIQGESTFDREAFLELAADDDQREDLMVALERTEALKAANHYHFFSDDQPKWPNSPFPVDSLPDEIWSSIYREDQSRTEACFSGLAAELAERYPLPMNITMWFASQLMHEPNEMLCEAYVEILRVSSRHHHAISMSDSIASLTSRYHTQSFFENERKDQVEKVLPTGLQYVLRTLQFCAPASDGVVSDATPTTTCAAFLDLALLNIDVLVREDDNLSRVVANCIQDMLEVLPERSFQMLVTEVVGALYVPSELPPLIRCRAISNLPCLTTRAYHLRRRLALESFSTVSDRKLASSQDWQASILHTLQNQPEIQISEDMDYDYLMAFIAVLDIAVASGFTEYSRLMPPALPKQTAGSLTFSKPPPLTETERAHNQQVDRLVEQLQSMMSRVKDSGTSHLGRTQAKSLIEGIVVRLESCVRTRQRPKKSAFSRGMQATFAMPTPAAAPKTRVHGQPDHSLEAKKERGEVEIVPLATLSDRENTPSEV